MRMLQQRILNLLTDLLTTEYIIFQHVVVPENIQGFYCQSAGSRIAGIAVTV